MGGQSSKERFSQAVERDDGEAIRRLLANNADPWQWANNGPLPASQAAYLGKMKALEAFVEQGGTGWYPKNHPNPACQSCLLHFAAAGNQVAATRYLLAQGANQRVHNKKGDAPSTIAVEKGHLDVLKVLLTEDTSNEAPRDRAHQNDDGTTDRVLDDWVHARLPLCAFWNGHQHILDYFASEHHVDFRIAARYVFSHYSPGCSSNQYPHQAAFPQSLLEWVAEHCATEQAFGIELLAITLQQHSLHKPLSFYPKYLVDWVMTTFGMWDWFNDSVAAEANQDQRYTVIFLLANAQEIDHLRTLLEQVPSAQKATYANLILRCFVEAFAFQFVITNGLEQQGEPRYEAREIHADDGIIPRDAFLEKFAFIRELMTLIPPTLGFLNRVSISLVPTPEISLAFLAIRVTCNKQLIKFEHAQQLLDVFITSNNVNEPGSTSQLFGGAVAQAQSTTCLPLACALRAYRALAFDDAHALVQCLLKKGANPDTPDSDGKTTLDHVEQIVPNQYQTAVLVLLSAYAS